MKPTARLIVMATVLPEPGTVSLREEAIERSKDLFMMQAMNGLERDLDQWTKLLQQVDRRLTLKTVTKPEGSNLSILEVVLLKESGRTN